MFMFVLWAKSRKLFFFLAKTTVILRYINLRTIEEVLHVLLGQLRLLEGTWQQLFL